MDIREALAQVLDILCTKIGIYSPLKEALNLEFINRLPVLIILLVDGRFSLRLLLISDCLRRNKHECELSRKAICFLLPTYRLPTYRTSWPEE